MKYSVKYLGPRPSIYHDDKAMSPDHVAQRLNDLEAALRKAHGILLHEMDNGRTPTQLQGLGLGHFEDVLAGVSDPVGVIAR